MFCWPYNAQLNIAIRIGIAPAGFADLPVREEFGVLWTASGTVLER